MSTETVKELEEHMQGLRALVERKDTVLRLQESRDFRRVIVDGFCGEDAARYAQISGDPSMAADARADALGMAQASGFLKRFLAVCVQMGRQAERELRDGEEALAEERSLGENS